MKIFEKRSPLQKKIEKIQKQEELFCKRREKKRDSRFNKLLADRVPKKLQDTLDSAFAGAFTLIFEKGTEVIEKTYNKEELEKTYLVNQYTAEIKKSKKSLQAFSKKAGNTGAKNLFLSGVSGIGLGLLGIGIPDIPLFTGMILKGIYEIALSYGYEYKTEKEQYFVLMLIQGALVYGDELSEIEQEINSYIEQEVLPPDYERLEAIKRTASCLSKELLYMKFLQGIPLVGAVGGAYDAVYMKQIITYTHLKYQRRFYTGKCRG